MLKFCLAGQYPLDESRIGGGVEHAVYTLAQAIRERDDVELHVVSPQKGVTGVRDVRSPGMVVHYVGIPSRKLVPNLLTTASRVIPVLKEISPDVVNSHHCVTTEAASRAGFTVVHHIHGITHREIKYASRRDFLPICLQNVLDHRAIGLADEVIGVSQYALDECRRWIKGKTHVIMLPIEDLFWEVPAPVRPRDVLFAGGIGRRKNLMVLIKAMPLVLEKHPDAKLTVCGGVVDRAYYNRIARVVEAHGMRESVRFHGVVDREKLVGFLDESVGLVIPSRQETTPTVICQAMAAGRVPIATPVGGVPEMIDDGVTGFLVDADDPLPLAARLIELLDDPAKVASMGEAGKAVARSRHERGRVAAAIVDVCRAASGNAVVPR